MTRKFRTILAAGAIALLALIAAPAPAVAAPPMGDCATTGIVNGVTVCDPAPAIAQDAMAVGPNAELIARLFPPDDHSQYSRYRYTSRAKAIDQFNSDVAYYGARTVILCWSDINSVYADRDCLKRADLMRLAR